MIQKLLFTILILSICINCAIADEPKGPELEFVPPSHDYGKVYADDLPDTQLAIEFTNTGDAPLILSQVRACCGTRVTQWPRQPINPGQKGIINIDFKLAPRAHRISRLVTVSSNAASGPESVFRINGEVIERAASPGEK